MFVPLNCAAGQITPFARDSEKKLSCPIFTFFASVTEFAAAHVVVDVG